MPAGKSLFTSVPEYLSAQPPELQRALKRVRAAIRKAVPSADEVISYNIPTFKLGKTVVLHVAGWKSFVSVYPANSRVVAAFGDELKPYLVEKSTLRFPLDAPIPVRLIERIAKFRATGGTPQGPSPTLRRPR